jgi:hypothetical protein
MTLNQTPVESFPDFAADANGQSANWTEIAADAYSGTLATSRQTHTKSDLSGYIQVARAEYHPDGTPIVVDAGPPMVEETQAADALEPVIRSLSAGQPLNVNELANQTRNAIDGKTNPDSVDNAVAWLEDFLGDRLHKPRDRDNFVDSPWNVRFRYKNDEITVKITHDYDKNLGTTVMFPRDPSHGPIRVLDK